MQKSGIRNHDKQFPTSLNHFRYNFSIKLMNVRKKTVSVERTYTKNNIFIN